MHLPRHGVNVSFGDYNHYEREGIVFRNDPDNANQQFLVENGEWTLVSLKLDTNPRIVNNAELIITYPMYTVTVELQRKASFYVIILMLPSILVSLISVIGFLLPSESGEKVSLQLTALLSYSLVFLVIVDIIPPVGGNFPLIGKFNQSLFQTHLKVILSNVSVKIELKSIEIEFQSKIYHFNFVNYFLLAQLLIAGQVSTTCNLILTVIFLRLFHHGPSPVPRKLRHIVFNIVAPMIFFDVKVDRISENISPVVPNKPSTKENGHEITELDSTDHKEKANMESLLEMFKTLKNFEGREDEINLKEWQTIAKVLDRLLFILNVISFSIAFGYGYTKLYT